MPSGMTGGRPAPASFDASLAARIGSFLTTGTIRPRPSSSAGCEKVPSGAVPLGKLDDLQVVFPDRGPELEVGGRDHDRLRRGVDRLAPNQPA